MNKRLPTDRELKSIEIIIQYLLDSENKHYEECEPEEKSGHIYEHVKLLE